MNFYVPKHLLFLLFFCGSILSASSQYVDFSSASIGSTVNALCQDANYIYIGGNFSVAGPNIGGYIKVTTTSANYDACLARVNGSVYTCISDGSSGWYIGGAFTTIGEVSRNNIAHILSNGTLDINWNPNANGVVYSMVLSGTDIYAGGDFTTIGGQSRNRIAKLNNTTGNADATWNANAGSIVRAVVLSGSDIYVGGDFTTIGGQTRNRIAKLNNTTGSADVNWNPNAGSIVRTIAISGNDIYVGGDFTTIGGLTRNQIAKLNNTTGTADAIWNPNAQANVWAIVTDGTDVYVAGGFSTIGGQTRSRIAKLNNTTGAADANWNPNSNAIVNSLALNGTDLYAGGDFTTIGGLTCSRIVRLSTTTGNADATWTPYNGGSVLGISIIGSDVFIYGGLACSNSFLRNRLARISLSTGLLDTQWNPNADGDVTAIAISGTDIYVAGKFTSIGGLSRRSLAKLNNTTGAADAAWNPNFDASGNDLIRSIAISGSDIYVGGEFSPTTVNESYSIGGLNRSFIVKLNNTTGAGDANWDAQVDNPVYSIATDGPDIYIAGLFATAGGQNRNYSAKLNNTTGAADATWNPDANSNPLTISINGSYVYVGGNFTTIGGQSLNRIARLNKTTGAADATWNPNANNAVRSIAVSGSDIYAGGTFNTIGGQSRSRIAKLNNTAGAADATWNPNIDNTVNAVAVNGSTVYAGGGFSYVGSTYTGKFAAIVPSNSYTWTGANSSDWIKGCNWSPAYVPTSNAAVTIPAGTTYAPDMGGYSYTIKNLTVNAGATAQLNSSTLTLSSDLVNNGTISNTNSTGSLTMSGSSAQQISGTGTIQNLTLNNSSGVTISSGQTSITGTLTVSTGTLTTGGFLTLKSSALATARVAPLVGSISGNVAVERYIPAKTGRKWTFIACPVSGTTIRNGWQDDVFISGVGTGGTFCGTNGAQYNSNGFDATQTAVPSMYTYNRAPVNGSRWLSVANTTASFLTPGTGYRMNIRGPRGTSDNNCTAQLTLLNPPSPEAVTLSASGSLMQGDQSITIVGKNSYNAVSGSGNAYTLVGNPYASEVSLQSLYSSNSANITSSFWFYTPLSSSNAYSTYNAATQQALDFPSGYTNGSVADVIIASGQAFLVERSAAVDGTITFMENHKSTTVTNGNNFYKIQNIITDKIKVQFSNANDTTESTSVFINYINDPGTSSSDITNFDSYSFNTGNSFYLVSQKAGKNLAIQTRPAFNSNDTISLNIKGNTGTYKLNFSEYEKFISAADIRLIDNYTGIETNVRSQNEYTFSITANASSQGANRFKIIFKPSNILSLAGIELTGVQKSSGIELNWVVLAEKDMLSYTIERSADGKTFAKLDNVIATNNNNASAAYTFTDTYPFEGDSYYRIKAEEKSGETFYSKTIKMQHGKPVTMHFYPNPVKDNLTIVLSATSGFYSLKIISPLGQEVVIINNIKPAAGSINIKTSSLSKGIYTVQVMNADGYIITERFIKD